MHWHTSICNKVEGKGFFVCLFFGFFFIRVPRKARNNGPSSRCQPCTDEEDHSGSHVRFYDTL